MTARTYWLSFCDQDTGESLGVCLVQVSEGDLPEAVSVIKRVNPAANPTDEETWVIAAIGQSLAMECNPGGSVESTQVDPAQLPGMPLNRLISGEELRRKGWA